MLLEMHIEIPSIIVIKDGYIVAEQYYTDDFGPEYKLVLARRLFAPALGPRQLSERCLGFPLAAAGLGRAHLRTVIGELWGLKSRGPKRARRPGRDGFS